MATATYAQPGGATRRKTLRVVGRTLLYLVALAGSALMLLPQVWMLRSSFMDINQIFIYPADLDPGSLGVPELPRCLRYRSLLAVLPEHADGLDPHGDRHGRHREPGRLRLRPLALAGPRSRLRNPDDDPDAALRGDPDPDLPDLVEAGADQHLLAADRSLVVRRPHLLHLPAAPVLPRHPPRSRRGGSDRRGQPDPHPVGHRPAAQPTGV